MTFCQQHDYRGLYIVGLLLVCVVFSSCTSPKLIHSSRLVMIEGAICDKRDERPLTGTAFSNYASGIRRAERAYWKGVLSGCQKTWHPNGNVAKREFYEDGIPSGKWMIWSSDGKKEMEILWHEGQKQVEVSWNADGTARRIVYYEERERQIVVQWDSQGKAIQRTTKDSP